MRKTRSDKGKKRGSYKEKWFQEWFNTILVPMLGRAVGYGWLWGYNDAAKSQRRP